MINLLPPETRSQLGAARANRLLLRYNFLLLAALAFLLAAIGLVYIYLGNAKTSAERTIAENIARAGDYSAVDAEANSFRQDLASAKQILDNDVTYTKVILEIAGVLPSGVVLDTLNLDSSTFGTPTTLTANVTDYSTVLRLKDALQKSSLFSDVSLQTISSEGTGRYPLQATLSVTIRKDAAR
jgi:Tfp pilus assembly protein PilN